MSEPKTMDHVMHGALMRGAKVISQPENKSSPDDLRALGWAVAVHNDYKLNGVANTFWLMTKDDRCLKGEGLTDADALDKIRDQLKQLMIRDAAKLYGFHKLTIAEEYNQTKFCITGEKT